MLDKIRMFHWFHTNGATADVSSKIRKSARYVRN